jgi:hypothetical protein
MTRILSALIVICVFCLCAPVFAEDLLFVHLEDALPQGNGKVMLVFTVENNDAVDLRSLDIVLPRGLAMETAELRGGWGLVRKSGQVFSLQAAGGVRPRAQGRFKVLVAGDLDIFRKRSLESLMTVTASYINGQKRVYEIGAPVLRGLR